MATTRKATVTVQLTIEVDANDWIDEYGCEPSIVHEDIRNYFDGDFIADMVLAAWHAHKAVSGTVTSQVKKVRMSTARLG